MGRTTRKKVQIEHRRTQVAELYLKGRTQVEIARELGVSQATISSDLKAMKKEWKEARVRDMDELIAEHIKKQQLLYREAWEGYEQSKEPLETTRVIQSNGQKRAEKTVRQRSANPGFLRIVRDVMERHSKLCDLEGAASVAKEQLNEEEAQKRANRIFFDMLSQPIDDPIERRLAEEEEKCRIAEEEEDRGITDADEGKPQ